MKAKITLMLSIKDLKLLMALEKIQATTLDRHLLKALGQ